MLAASATNTIDITGGITNAFGEVLTMAEVRLISFSAATANAGTISVGGSATPFSSWFGDVSDVLVLRPGSGLLLTGPDATGYVVGGGLLQFVNDSGDTNSSAVIDVYIGASDG